MKNKEYFPNQKRLFYRLFYKHSQDVKLEANIAGKQKHTRFGHQINSVVMECEI